MIDFELDNLEQANRLLTHYHDLLEHALSLSYHMTEEFEIRNNIILPNHTRSIFKHFEETAKFKYKEDLL